MVMGIIWHQKGEYRKAAVVVNRLLLSAETLMAISVSLNMPLDYIIYGKSGSDQEKEQHTEEVAASLDL